MWTTPNEVESCLENLVEASVGTIHENDLRRVFIERRNLEEDEIEVRIYTRQLLEWNTIERLEMTITAKKLEQFVSKDE